MNKTEQALTTAIDAIERAKKLPVWDGISHSLHAELDIIFRAIAALSQSEAPAEQPEDERERFEAWEQRHMLERGFPPFQFEVWQAAKRDALTQAQERAAVTDEVRDLIAWLLGEGGEFPECPEKVEGKIQPLYWWRKELRRRWNGILSASSEGKKP